MSHDLADCFTGEESDCCGARVLVGGLCAHCKEHCETFQEEETTTTDKKMNSEVQIDLLNKASELTSEQVLNWLAAQAMLSGIKGCTVSACISQFPGAHANPANGFFMVDGINARGKRTSSSCHNTVEEAVQTWIATNPGTPLKAAEELRAEARVLLRQANDIEAGSEP